MYTFVIVGSLQCPPCMKLKEKVLPDLRQWIHDEMSDKLELVEITLKDFDKKRLRKEDPPPHPNLGELIQSFPFLAIFAKEAWDDHTSDLLDFACLWRKGRERTLDNIKDWILRHVTGEEEL